MLEAVYARRPISEDLCKVVVWILNCFLLFGTWIDIRTKIYFYNLLNEQLFKLYKVKWLRLLYILRLNY